MFCLELPNKLDFRFYEIFFASFKDTSKIIFSKLNRVSKD